MTKSTVVHGDPKAPAPKSSTQGSTPRFNSDNTSRAKLIRMGQNPKVSCGGGPSTGA
jgi:hypothetical protein